MEKGLTIFFDGVGGMLETRNVPKGASELDVVMDMLRNAGELHPGDVIRVELWYEET